MKKHIEATKYIKRYDLLAYPLRRATLDKELSGTYFVNGVEAAMEYAEKLPFVECKAYARSGEDPELLELKDITEYIDLADLMKCPLLEIDLDRTLNKNWYFLSGLESVMEYARHLPAVRVKMNNEVNDIIPVYARRMVDRAAGALQGLRQFPAKRARRLLVRRVRLRNHAGRLLQLRRTEGVTNNDRRPDQEP